MKNVSKSIKLYSIYTQGIITILFLGISGFYVGYLIDKNGIEKGILAVVGVIIGIIAFIRHAIFIGGDIDG